MIVLDEPYASELLVSWLEESQHPVLDNGFARSLDVYKRQSMHNEQFEGLTWLSVPLFEAVRVWLLGASDAASEVAALAAHVGFDVTVVDYDPAYVSEARFPSARRIVLEMCIRDRHRHARSSDRGEHEPGRDERVDRL